MNMGHPVYSARPLHQVANGIRILNLQPGRWQDEICCTLTVVSLDDGTPKYEALSYVWGPETGAVGISLDGHVILVRKILFYALRRLRRATEARPLWVDALCINQSDDAEKSAQVAIMSTIYQRSHEVWIWLLEYESNSPRLTQTVEEAGERPWKEVDIESPFFDGGTAALSIVSELASLQTKHLHEYGLFTTYDRDGTMELRIASRVAAEALEAFAMLLVSPWWRRVWTIQECIFALSPVVLVGPLQIIWAEFWLAARYLQSHSKCCMKLLKSMPGIRKLFEEFIIVVMQRATTWENHLLERDHSSNELHDLMWQFRSYDSTYPADKVYALLGFLPDDDANPKPSPDYSLSTKEVYKQAVMYSIRQTKTLCILNGQRCSSASTERGSSRMPTWIYDWSVKVDWREWHVERQRLRTNNYKASGTEEACINWDESFVLRLDGIFLDSIIAVGPVVELENKPEEAVKEWLRIADLSSYQEERYAGGGSFIEAFWRTLTRDYSLNKDMEFERVRNPDGHVLSATEWWDSLSNGRQLWSKDPADFGSLLYNMCHGTQFFFTSKGYMGMGNPKAHDRVFVLRGGNIPFVLRSDENVDSQYTVVGNCYVHGFMDGQILDGPWQRVVLV